jgi:hypothetical protein
MVIQRKKKSPSARTKTNIELLERKSRRSSEGKTPILKNRRPDLDQVTQRSFCNGLMLKWTTMVTPGGLAT